MQCVTGHLLGRDEVAVDADAHDVARDPGLERIRRVVGDDLTSVHHQQPVGEQVGFVEVVRAQHDRDALVVTQRSDVVPQVRSALRVESRGRLVEEHQHRRVHQTEGHVEPAALTAGHLRQRPPLEPGEVESRQEFGEAGRRVRLAHALQSSLGDELLAEDGAGRRGRPDLGDVADPPPDLARFRTKVDAGDGRRTGGRTEQGGEHAQRGGLARTVGSEQTDDLPGRTSKSMPCTAATGPVLVLNERARPCVSIIGSGSMGATILKFE